MREMSSNCLAEGSATKFNGPDTAMKDIFPHVLGLPYSVIVLNGSWVRP